MDMDKARQILEDTLEQLEKDLPNASYRDKLGLVKALQDMGVEITAAERRKQKHEPLGLPDLKLVEKEAKAVS